MRNFFLMIGLFGYSFLVAQSSLPFREGGKWGLIDPSKKVILNPTYDFIFNFKNLNYALFMKRGKYGVIDKTGNVTVPARYQTLKILNERFFAFRSQYFFGILNASGETVAPEIFKTALSLSDELILMENDTSKLFINTNSSKNYWTSGFQVEKLNDKLILFNQDSCILLNSELEEIAFSSSRNYYKDPNSLYFSGENSFYFIPDNFIGKFRKEHQPFGNFNADKAWYIVEKNALFGLFDPLNDAYVLQPEYDWFERLNAQFTKVKKGDFFGIIDQNGNWFLKPEFSDVFLFSNGFFVQNSSGKSGLINFNGNPVIPIRYDWISDQQTHYEVELAGRIGIYSKSGVQIESPKYHEIRSVDGSFKCYAGPIKNKKGKVIKYQKVVSFDLTGTRVSGRVEFENVGIINISGIMKKTLRTRDGLNLSQDSIFRWKREEKRLILKAKEYKVKLWGFRDTSFSRYMIRNKFDQIDVFLDRNYTLARLYNYNRRRTLSTPLGDLQYKGKYDLIDHDNIRKYPDYPGFLSLKSVYQNKGYLEFFTGEQFVYRSLDSLSEIRYTFVDDFNSDGTRRVALHGKYQPCNPFDTQVITNSKELFGRINEYFNDSVPFNKREMLIWDFGYKNVPYKIENASWNLITDDHVKLLPENYQFIGNPIRHKYLTKYKGRWGLISRDSTLIPHQFFELDRMRSEEDSIFISAQKQFKEFVIDSLGNKIEIPEGRKIMQIEGNAILFYENGKYGLMNKKLEVLIPAEFGRLKNLGYGWFRYRKRGKIGLLRADGGLIEPKYDELEPLSTEFIKFNFRRNSGLLNSRGDTVLAPIYQSIQVEDEMFIYEEMGKSYIKKKGDLKAKKVKGQFLSVFGAYLVFQYKQDLLLYDEEGKLMNKYKKASYQGHTNTMILIEVDGKNRFYDQSLQLLKEEEGDVELLANNYYKKTIDREIFIHEVDQEQVVDRGNIMKVQNFDHLLVYRSDGRYRLLNTLTKERFDFPPDLAKVVDYQKDYFVIQKTNRKLVYVDLKGQAIYPREFDRASPFENGYAVVEEDGEVKIFYQDGTMIEGLVYHLIRPLDGGFFKAQILKSYGLIDENKGILVKAEYDRILFSNHDLVQLVKDGDVFYYDFGRQVMIK